MDNNNAVLGKVTTVNRNSIVFLTSTGYFITIQWTGVFAPAQIYYTSFSAGTCSETAYLNSGSSVQFAYARTLSWSGSLNTFMSFASGPLLDGTVASVAMSGVQGIDNPLCISFTSTATGWLLTPIARSAAGLPPTVVPPLTLV